MAWIGVDLDGTLAHYDHWRGLDHIGEPIPLMVKRVKRWLSLGLRVKIVTARAHPEFCRSIVRAWCLEHIGVELEITNARDFEMTALWDHRAIQVEQNNGERIDKQDETIGI